MMTKSYIRSLPPLPTQECVDPCTRVSEDDPISIQTPFFNSHLVLMLCMALMTTLIVTLSHARDIDLSVLVYLSLDTHPPASICCQYMELKINFLGTYIKPKINS